MIYLITFLEGVVTFISPCLLPMLPIYVSYLAGQNTDRKKTLINTLGFVLGFTIMFVLLGAFAASLGNFFKIYSNALNILLGAIIILFGVNIIKPFIKFSGHIKYNSKNFGFLSSVIFGIVFSLGWTPCVGAFLGTSLMLAAANGNSLKGVLMLLCYALGLGLPFVISALLIDRLKTTFDFIKKHFRIINAISGGFLILIGVLMATGILGYYLSLVS